MKRVYRILFGCFRKGDVEGYEEILYIHIPPFFFFDNWRGFEYWMSHFEEHRKVLNS